MTLERLTTPDEDAEEKSALGRLREATGNLLNSARLVAGGIGPEDWPATSGKTKEGELSPRLRDVPEHPNV